MQQAHSISRRDFLKTSTGAACAAHVLGGSVSLGAERRTRWIVACRDAFLARAGTPDCWSAMKELGVGGVEVNATEDLLCPALHHPEKKYSLASRDDIALIREELQKHSVAITAFCMYNRLDERLERELAWARKLVQAGVELGVSVIRIDVVPHKMGIDEFLPFAVKACKRLCELAKGTPVRFGIENHGRVTNDPQFLERLFDGVGSPKLGLTLDFMNFYWYGHPLKDLYGIYKKFAPRTFHTHCKNLRYPDDKKNVRRPIGWEYAKYSAPLYEGDIDYRRVAKILRESGYQGDLCLEDESLRHFPKEQQAEVLKKDIALLQSIA